MEMRIDAVTKIFVLAFITAVSYLFFSVVLEPIFVQQPRTMMEAMRQTANFNSVANVLAIVIALGIGLFASFNLKTYRAAKTRGERALSIVKRKLSSDEKKMLKEIEQAGSITQDSLRARLEWSKAKTSTILTRLDRMNLVQRERQGKTYKVFLQKDLR